MALSKLDILPRAQHFLECGIEECERNCEFYCNSCHQRLCEQCRDEHLKSPENKNHEVVLYQQRKRQLPVEKCKIHPTKDIDMFCEECEVPLCSKCATKGDHQRHTFVDLETIYAEKIVLFQEEISKIHNYFLPISQDLQREIKDSSQIKHIMDNIRTSMKTEGESLKSLVDTVISENMKQLDQIEYSLLEDLNTQDKTLDDYITYLNNLDKELHICLSSTEPQKLMSEKKPKIRPIPETTKPVTPRFTAGQHSKSDVTELLGKIHVPNTKAKREIRPMESVYNTAMKSTHKQMKEDRKKSDSKQTMSLSTSVTKVREFKVPGVRNVYHISLDQLDRLWISDNVGNFNLVQTDLQGNEIQKIETSGGMEGFHTVTQDGDLIFTDRVINRIYITQDNNITEFIKTGDWRPYSIYSSHINGDLLVGMKKIEQAKVTRYNKTGKELQNIQRDNKGQRLYKTPHYITENINGDICTSDRSKGVVVVNKCRQHRFSYTGQESGFHPYGICTDVLGHILVCDGVSNTVHLLDQDGQFLSLLITQQQGVENPRSVCVDDENNLYVGQPDTNTLRVYKYLL